MNHYKYAGGVHTTKEARAWMEAIGWLVKTSHLEEWKLPLAVRCSGRFKDKRSQPDLSNLSKCLLDAIQEATGINDREMRWQDGEVSYGRAPALIITITEAR